MRLIQDNLLIIISPFLMFSLLRFMFLKSPKRKYIFVIALLVFSIIPIFAAIQNKATFYISSPSGQILLDPTFIGVGNILAIIIALLLSPKKPANH